MNGGLKIVGLTRVRNEELLIADLLDHLAQWCDVVYVYDDCSTDATLDIISSFRGIPVHVLRGERWSENRLAEETVHRASLLRAASLAGFDWCVYIDADERLDFDLREHLEREPSRTRAISLRLYDAYLTIDSDPYTGGSIARLPRAYGVEYRDITMVWRGGARADFVGRDQREPTLGLFQRVEKRDWRVKHFGKAISDAAWDAKCEYYATYFPEPYKSKWAARKGHAAHQVSDFGRPLVEWHQLHGENSVDITPLRNWRSLFRRAQVDLARVLPS